MISYHRVYLSWSCFGLGIIASGRVGLDGVGYYWPIVVRARRRMTENDYASSANGRLFLLFTRLQVISYPIYIPHGAADTAGHLQLTLTSMPFLELPLVPAALVVSSLSCRIYTTHWRIGTRYCWYRYNLPPVEQYGRFNRSSFPWPCILSPNCGPRCPPRAERQ